MDVFSFFTLLPLYMSALSRDTNKREYKQNVAEINDSANILG
jgi:hypothetical protein